MIGLVGRVWPKLAIVADARLLDFRSGADAAAMARDRIATATRAGDLDAIRHWTGVWAELMRVSTSAATHGRRGLGNA